MLRALLSMGLLASSLSAIAARPLATVPMGHGTVLERLPRGYSTIAPARGQSPTASMARAANMLAIAARTGDSRIAARADAILSSYPAGDPSPALLRARAFSAQHRHDFNGSLVLLDRLIGLDPRDGDARMARLQILLVQGKLDQARSECGALALGIDSDLGLVCVAAISLRSGRTGSAIAMLDRWLAGATPDREMLRYVLVMRAEASARAGMKDADRWFRQALAVAPEDVRSLSPYIRHLRATGRNPEAMSMAARHGNDALQLQLALAAHAMGHPSAPSLARAQGRRYALARALGNEPELRDEAEYLLVLRGDAMSALELASRNFRQQRDFEDVELLKRTALAAGRPGALAPLHAWARSQRIDVAGPGPGGR